MSKPCDIIMPVWNQLAFTKDCIDSILKNTDGDYRIIIIDNASDDKTSKYLSGLKERRMPEIMVVRNGINLGFVKAANQGMGLSNAPYMCILNNDTIVTKGWLKVMLDVANLHGEIGVVNPSSNNLGQRPSEGEPLQFYADKLRKESDKFIELGAAIGFCMLIKRDVVDRIGMFDEIYGMGNFEDTDFSRRAIKEGYKCIRACGAYVYHRENSSFDKLNSFEENFKRNKQIYEFRWGKPKRIAYIVDFSDDNLMRRLNTESIRSARNGNWVWYFSKERLNLPAHSNIIARELNPNKFYLKVLFEILKKKKKFDEIFAGEGRFGKVLERLSFIHKAKVLYY